MSHPFATGSLIAVAVLSAVLAALAYRAYLATGRRPLLFVMGAFFLFAVKGGLTAWALATDSIGHEVLEVVGGGFDLAIVLLLVAPFLRR